MDETRDPDHFSRMALTAASLAMSRLLCNDPAGAEGVIATLNDVQRAAVGEAAVGLQDVCGAVREISPTTAEALALAALLRGDDSEAERCVGLLGTDELADLAQAASHLKGAAQERHLARLRGEPDPSPSETPPELPAPLTEARLRRMAEDAAHDVIASVKREVERADLPPEAVSALVQALERVTHPAMTLTAPSALRPHSPEDTQRVIDLAIEQVGPLGGPVLPDDSPELLRPTITEISPDIREHHPELADALEKARGDRDVLFAALPPDSPFVVGCAYCRMPVGEPCRDITAGIIVPIHRERREEAYKVHHALKSRPAPDTVEAFSLVRTGHIAREIWPLGVECPVCAQAPGEPCVTPTGVPMDPHDSRVQLANDSGVQHPSALIEHTVDPDESREEALARFDAEHPPVEPTPLKTGVEGLRDFIERTGVDPEGYEVPEYQRAFYDELQSGDPTGQAAVNQADSEEAFLARERADAEPLRRAMANGLGMKKVQFHDCESTDFEQDGKTGVFWCIDCGRPVRPKDDPIAQQDAADGAPE